MHRLDAFLSRAVPAYEGSITYGPGQGHCWMGISEREMMRQMARRVEAHSSGSAATDSTPTSAAWKSPFSPYLFPPNPVPQDGHIHVRRP